MSRIGYKEIDLPKSCKLSGSGLIKTLATRRSRWWMPSWQW